MSVYKNNDKWYCQFQIDGERKHRACKGAKNRKEAEKLEQGFMYQLQQQQNGVMPRKEKKISVDKLCDKFLEYSKLNKKSYKQDISRIKIIRQYLKKYKYVNDIKHTVGTRLAQNNVPIPVIKEVLDHSDIKTTMRYVHTANEQILSAMNKLNSYNKDILQNP